MTKTPDAEIRVAMLEAAMDIHYGADVWRDFEEGYIAQACSRVYAALTAAILAMEARGYKVTGPEATEKMDIAARDWSATKFGKPIGSDASRGCWEIQHSAAPKWEDK